MIHSEMMESNTQKFHIMEKRRVPDEDGGTMNEWVEGMEFDAIVRHDTTILAQQAESQGTASTYTFLIPRNVKLSYPDAVKRISDGETFQITSDSEDSKTPKTSRLNMAAVTAKKWRLT